MIPTFIYPTDEVMNNTIILRGDEARHISAVLRLGRGEQIRMIDGRGTAHICEIVSIASQTVSARIIKTLKNSGEPRLHLTMGIGLSNSSKFDTIIEKGTEVGVSLFVPLLTEKSKVKTGDKGAATRKMNRWQRVCRAAVKQSGRSRIPDISRPVEFYQFLEHCNPEETCLFHPGEGREAIETLPNLQNKSCLTVLIGPESGFSPAEIQTVRERSINVISLGNRILRTETAGVVIPALVIYLSERAKA
jgi:16S rRNA (uracil1498-N3)-methyltransferase